MFVTEEMIVEMADKFGQPERAEYRIKTDIEELNFIRSTQKSGRNHDVTIYIHKDNQIIVIAKPFYLPGLYRAPSGGLNPGESFLDGIDREIAEETGCEIELEQFILRTDVTFVRADDVENSDKDSILWRSFVFQARYKSGDFQFTDHKEISEVRLASLDEFEEFSRIMRGTTIGGLHYRAKLHDTVKGLLSFNKPRVNQQN